MPVTYFGKMGCDMWGEMWGEMGRVRGGKHLSHEHRGSGASPRALGELDAYSGAAEGVLVEDHRPFPHHLLCVRFCARYHDRAMALQA